MKKKNIKNLKLNKKSVSFLDTRGNNVKGGLVVNNTFSCFPNGICGVTQGCQTNNGCGGNETDNCGTNNCGSRGCFTISCPINGIC